MCYSNSILKNTYNHPDSGQKSRQMKTGEIFIVHEIVKNGQIIWGKILYSDPVEWIHIADGFGTNVYFDKVI